MYKKKDRYLKKNDNKLDTIKYFSMLISLLTISLAIFQYSYTEISKIKQNKTDKIQKAFEVIIDYPFDDQITMAHLIMNIGVFNTLTKHENNEIYFESIAKMFYADIDFKNKRQVRYVKYLSDKLVGYYEYISAASQSKIDLNICQSVYYQIIYYANNNIDIVSKITFNNQNTSYTIPDYIRLKEELLNETKYFSDLIDILEGYYKRLNINKDLESTVNYYITEIAKYNESAAGRIRNNTITK